MPRTLTASSLIKRCLVLCATLSTVLTVTSCGDSGTSQTTADMVGQKKEVRTTLSRFYDAFEEGNAAGMCALLAADAHDEIVASLGAEEGRTCTQAFTRLFEMQSPGGLSSELTVRFRKIAVTDDKALARVTVDGGPLTELPLVRRAGDWQIASWKLGG